jgi:hypothetical protein
MQVVVYAWIWKMVYPQKTKTFRIFNIKTNEIRRLQTNDQDLDKIMYEIFRGKYLKESPISDEEFIHQCNQITNQITKYTV